MRCYVVVTIQQRRRKGEKEMTIWRVRFLEEDGSLVVDIGCWITQADVRTDG